MNAKIHFERNYVTSFTVLYNIMHASKLLFHVNVIKLNLHNYLIVHSLMQVIFNQKLSLKVF